LNCTNLICYGVDGETTFQGPKTWVMMEWNEKHVSFMLELFIGCCNLNRTPFNTCGGAKRY
jgi:hypothetical protein